MKFNIITIFPKIFDSYLNESILKRAQKNKLIDIKIHNLRDFTEDKHRKVDDRPFGGGPGMVFKIEPIIKAISSILKNQKSKKTKIILLTPSGKQFDNKIAAGFAKEYNNLILICGRYEGIDARVKKVIRNLKLEISELSIGPYVLTGGELPAMVLIDAVSRQISGVLGNIESLEERRHGLPVYPVRNRGRLCLRPISNGVYTRPEVFEYPPAGGKKYRVPKILLSGHHKKIEEWAKKQR